MPGGLGDIIPGDIGNLLAELQQAEASANEKSSADETSGPAESKVEEEPDEWGPYRDNLTYLNDHFQLTATRLEIYKKSMEEDYAFRYSSKEKPEQKLRELKAKEKKLTKQCQIRTQLTTEAEEDTGFIPRLERLAVARNLDDFEKLIIITLIGKILCVEIKKHLSQYHHRSLQ